MPSQQNPEFKLSLSLALFAVALSSTMVMEGQSPSSRPVGVPEDWSHHHLVYSNPGTFTDALKAGTLAQWYRITNDPRYQIQHLKGDLTPRALAGARDFAARSAIVNAVKTTPTSTAKASSTTTLKRDWSMDLGAVQAAATGTVNTNNASTSPLSSLTVDGVTFDASSTTAFASASASFTANPENGDTLVITNGANSETLTATGAAYASATGTFSTRASTGAALEIVNGGTTLTLTAGTANSASCGTGPNYTATFDRGSFETSSSWASGLATVIGTCGSHVGVAASGTSPSITLTATTIGAGGNSISVRWTGTSNFSPAWSTATDFTGGATLQTGTGYFAFTTSGGTALSTTSTAANLASAITNVTVGVTGSSTGAQVTIKADTAGPAGNGIDLTDGLSNISFPASLSGGSDGTTSTTFGYLGLTSDQVAANIASAINSNPTLQTTSTGVFATSSGNVVTVTARTAGTGGDAYGLGQSNFSGFSWSGSTLTNGATTSAGTVGAGVFPAKYSFDTSSANCDDTSTPDFVIFNTGLAGGSTQPSIVAYDNIYSGCPTNVPVPNLYWQYNTGGTIGTSVSLSQDGTQVVFVQTNGGTASLVMLKWADNPDIQTLSSVANGSYRGCTAPCMTSITFSGSPNDTISSPFYDYTNDVVYVGDANGNLHKFTGVFLGTPAEAGTPWPVAVSAAGALTSPVYDSTSGLVFAGNQSTTAGYLYSVSATGTVVRSYQLAVDPGILDGPIVDSSAERVYVFVAKDMNGSNSNSPCDPGNEEACDGVYQLPATFTSTTKWDESVFGIGTTAPLYAGTFDNVYLSSANPGSPTGNLYTCGYNGSTGRPKFMDATVSANAFTNESGFSSISVTDGTNYYATNISNPMTSGAADCSPVTEIYNGTTDYFFVSVTANGNLAATGSNTCTGACLYSYSTTGTLTFQGSSATTTKPTEGLAATGGTSGIVIDNTVSGGGSQIYFTPLSSQTCTGNTNGTGAGTGACAVQASQSALQ